MGSRIVKVFYDQSCYPFKDSERTVRYPITGSSFAGSSNVNELHFYVRDIGGVNNLSWVAIVKLPNGKILYQLLTDIHLDSEINEYYLTFNLSQFYTQLKGDIYISLNGCMGQVTITTDEETDISTIQGEIDSRTVVATGAVKFSINYAPQRPIGFSFELDQYETIINALANKANIINTIQIVADIQEIDSDSFNEGQLFYDLASQEYYQLNQYGAFVQVLLDSKHHLNRYIVNESNITLLQLHNLFGERLAVVNDIFFQLSEYSGSGTNVSAYDLALQQYYYQENIPISSYLDNVLALSNAYTYRKKTNSSNVVYATDNTGNDTEIGYSVNAESNKIVRRDANGQVKVPLTPGVNADATSKKYVDDIDDALRDLIDTLKKNAFINVDITLYPTLNSFLATTGEEGYIYLYPIKTSESPTFESGYYQYIWEKQNGSYHWQYLGTTQIDLSDYALTSYVDNRDNYIIGLYNNLNYELGQTNDELSRLAGLFSLYGSYYIGGHTLYVDTAPISDNTITLVGTVSSNTLSVTPVTSFYTKSETNALLYAKVDKTSQSYKVYGTGYGGAQTTYNVDSFYDGNIARRDSDESITIPLIPTQNGHAASKQYVDGMAYSLVVSMSSSTYVISFTLKDKNGNTLSSQSVDLPLESVVVDGDYDSDTKTIVLTLNNGSTISIPVGDLVDGLVSNSDLQTTLNNYYTKSQVDDLNSENLELVRLAEHNVSEFSKSIYDNNYVITNTLYNKNGSVANNTLTIAGNISNDTLSLTTTYVFYTKAQVDQFGKSIEMSLDNQTYDLTIALKDNNGNTISTDTVSLPLESIIVDGSYDDQTQSIILELDSGQNISIPVSDLVSGLVNTEQLNTTLQNYATKQELQAQNTLLQNELDSVKLELDNLASLLNLVVDNFIANNKLYSKTTTISNNTATFVGTISGNTLVLTTSAN